MGTWVTLAFSPTDFTSISTVPGSSGDSSAVSRMKASVSNCPTVPMVRRAGFASSRAVSTGTWPCLARNVAFMASSGSIRLTWSRPSFSTYSKSGLADSTDWRSTAAMLCSVCSPGATTSRSSVVTARDGCSSISARDRPDTRAKSGRVPSMLSPPVSHSRLRALSVMCLTCSISSLVRVESTGRRSSMVQTTRVLGVMTLRVSSSRRTRFTSCPNSSATCFARASLNGS